MTEFWICLWWFAVVVVFSGCFYLGWNSCVISLNDNFVFLIGFCQQVKLLKLVKLVYFTLSNYCLLQKFIYISLLYVSKLNLKLCKSIIFAISINLQNLFVSIRNTSQITLRRNEQITSQLTFWSWLAGFCSIGAATEGYFRTDYSSKILLLLQLLYFIDVFELAISTDYHPTSDMIVQGGYFLSFRDAG